MLGIRTLDRDSAATSAAVPPHHAALRPDFAGTCHDSATDTRKMCTPLANARAIYIHFTSALIYLRFTRYIRIFIFAARSIEIINHAYGGRRKQVPGRSRRV